MKSGKPKLPVYLDAHPPLPPPSHTLRKTTSRVFLSLEGAAPSQFVVKKADLKIVEALMDSMRTDFSFRDQSSSSKSNSKRR